MPSGRIDYKKFRDSLHDDKSKEELDRIFNEQKSVQLEIIEDNISKDKEHLLLVNFCIDPFKYKAFLHSQTGYMFVRAEPLYRLGKKNFDIAIYNATSKVLILVECKSSIYDGKKVIEDLLQKIKVVDDNNSLLEELIGDEIKLKEYVICSMAGHLSKLKPFVIANDAPICLWSADIFGETLLLEKIKDDTSTEIACGRLHKDDKLRRLLLKGVKSAYGPTRLLTFLPSSHPCTILEEVCATLNLHLEKSNRGRFRLSDIQNLLENEKSLCNFTQEEIWKFSINVLKEGLKIGVFSDCTPSESDISAKEFEFGIAHRSTKSVINGVKKQYRNFYAIKKAEEKALEEFKRRISKKFKTLEEF